MIRLLSRRTPAAEDPTNAATPGREPGSPAAPARPGDCPPRVSALGGPTVVAEYLLCQGAASTGQHLRPRPPQNSVSLEEEDRASAPLRR